MFLQHFLQPHNNTLEEEIMSWTDQRSKAVPARIVSHLPSSQPKCQANVSMFGWDNEKPRRDVQTPKGKNTTICLGRQAKGIDNIQSDAQARAIEFSEKGHRLQRLTTKPDEMESRSPERCLQTSITSIAHRDLKAGGIEAVLRRSGADGLHNASSARSRQLPPSTTASTVNDSGATADGGEDDDVPPLEVLADEGWAKPRVDPDKIRDPYLRQQGLHINDPGVYSHISKRLVSSRSLTKAIVDKSVDFNFQYTKKR